jgi:hypothetical protein
MAFRATVLGALLACGHGFAPATPAMIPPLRELVSWAVVAPVAAAAAPPRAPDAEGVPTEPVRAPRPKRSDIRSKWGGSAPKRHSNQGKALEIGMTNPSRLRVMASALRAPWTPHYSELPTISLAWTSFDRGARRTRKQVVLVGV